MNVITNAWPLAAILNLIARLIKKTITRNHYQHRKHCDLRIDKEKLDAVQMAMSCEGKPNFTPHE